MELVLGQEIKTAKFCHRDFQEFYERLERETKILQEWFADQVFEQDGSSCGYELEGWILDKEQRPASRCENLLESLQDPQTVPELSLFNFEYNSRPRAITADLLRKFHEELTDFLKHLRSHARQMDCDITTIGTLPTLTKRMLSRKNLHPNKRYVALNRQLKKLREGKPFSVEVDGKEKLELTHSNVLIETVATSLQIHLQMQASKAVRYYNAAHIIAAPLVAVASNSPFLFGKSLWEESRIPVFEQAVAIPHQKNYMHKALDRVTLGSGYVRERF